MRPVRTAARLRGIVGARAIGGTTLPRRRGEKPQRRVPLRLRRRSISGGGRCRSAHSGVDGARPPLEAHARGGEVALRGLGDARELDVVRARAEERRARLARQQLQHKQQLQVLLALEELQEQVAVCNLASISLKKFVKDDGTLGVEGFDHQKLYEVTRVVTRNLNKVIDINYYPVKEAKHSNLRHRPVGIGIQGLADTFMELRMPYQSPEAKQLNKEIFETIYFAAMSMSKDLAIEEGAQHMSALNSLKQSCDL